MQEKLDEGNVWYTWILKKHLTRFPIYMSLGTPVPCVGLRRTTHESRLSWTRDPQKRRMASCSLLPCCKMRCSWRNRLTPSIAAQSHITRIWDSEVKIIDRFDFLADIIIIMCRGKCMGFVLGFPLNMHLFAF